jgi:hypothetical protein
MKKKSLAIGVAAICLLSIACAGCAKEDNGPSTQRDSMKQVLSPTQRQKIQNDPNIPPGVKAMALNWPPQKNNGNVPPQYRGGGQGK